MSRVSRRPTALLAAGWVVATGLAIAVGYFAARALRPWLLPPPAMALHAELPSYRTLPRGVVELLTPPREPVPQPAMAKPLRLVMERLDGSTLLDVQPFDEQGVPRAEAFAQINRAFRARGGELAEIDPRLIELLMSLSQAFEGRPLALVSGHRVPGKGTSRKSYHVKGMAADVALAGVKVHDLRDEAVRLGAWGVGVIPKFIHVDVRRDQPYRWVGGRWPRRWRRWRRR